MTFTVTLSDLRHAMACFDGYNKLVRSLQHKPFTSEDDARKSYIRFAHDAPIPLLDILDSNDLSDALWACRCVKDHDRDLRLFAVWCARQVEHLSSDTRIKNCNDTTENFANGQATPDELATAGAAAKEAAWASAVASARAAAWAAARAAQKGMFIKMCQGNAPWQQKG